MRSRPLLPCRSTLLVVFFVQLLSNYGWAASPDQPTGALFDEVGRTKHNLGLSSGQACIFCHTAGDYNSSPLIETNAGAQAVSFNPPLWDEKTTVKSFEVAPLKYPSGPSSACLACHDDALATGLHGLNHPIDMGYPRQPDGHFVPRNNTPDLARYWSVPDRTPSGVSMPTGPHSEYLYLPAGPDSQDPAVTSRLVRTTQGSVHCDSCHNPHNASIAPFLRANPKTLCLICHDR